MAATDFIGAYTYRGSSTASPSVNKPAGVVEGDLLLLAVVIYNHTAFPTTPSGWSIVASEISGDLRYILYSKVAGASEPSSYTAALGTARWAAMAIVAYEQAVITASATIDSGVDSTSNPAPSITPTGAGRVVAFYGMQNANILSNTYTMAAGVTERADQSGSAPVGLAVGDYAVAGGTATGTKTATCSHNQWDYAASQVGMVGNNVAPNAPTITNPAADQTIDRTTTERIDWDFNDPDVGDTQSAFDLQIRDQGDVALVVDLADQETPNTYWDMAGGTLAVGDYELRVRTYDAQGAQGPWSGWVPFSAAEEPSPPTPTAPTSGATITQEDQDVTWSTPTQGAYQLRRVADDAGISDPATVYFDSGTVESTSARSLTVSFETNNRWEWIQIRIRRDGLWSEWAEVRVQVAYTPPAAPTATVTAGDASIEISGSHPAPSGDEPTVTGMDVYRRQVGEDGEGVRIAATLPPAATFVDRTVASGVAYEYRVRDLGDNGVATYSAWVT